jgi:hypothetical protein
MAGLSTHRHRVHGSTRIVLAVWGWSSCCWCSASLQSPPLMRHPSNPNQPGQPSKQGEASLPRARQLRPTPMPAIRMGLPCKGRGIYTIAQLSAYLCAGRVTHAQTNTLNRSEPAAHSHVHPHTHTRTHTHATRTHTRARACAGARTHKHASAHAHQRKFSHLHALTARAAVCDERTHTHPTHTNRRRALRGVGEGVPPQGHAAPCGR